MTRSDRQLLGAAVVVMEVLIVYHHGWTAMWLPLVAGALIGRELEFLHQRQLQGEARGPMGLRMIPGDATITPAPERSASPAPVRRSKRRP